MGGGLQFLNTKSWHPSRRDSFDETFQFEMCDTAAERERMEEMKKMEEAKKLEELRQLYDEELRREAEMERSSNQQTPTSMSLSKMGSMDCMHHCDMALRQSQARTAAESLLHPERKVSPKPTLKPVAEDTEADKLKKMLAAMEAQLAARDAQINQLKMQVATMPVFIAAAGKHSQESSPPMGTPP